MTRNNQSALTEFIPGVVCDYDRSEPWQEWIPGSVLFADVSGFTPMSEALSQLGAEGAEVLTDILNRYFDVMIGIINDQGGQVMKFGGDAILCFFPGDQSLVPALCAAWDMQAVMDRFQKIKTPVKSFALKMKIGVAFGDVLLAGVGNPDVRRDFVFAGEPVDASADAEHHASAGDIVLASQGDLPGSLVSCIQGIEQGFSILTARPEKGSASGNGKDSDGQCECSHGESPLQAYLIKEIADMVLSGYHEYVGSLHEFVPVFMQFTGFKYTVDEFFLSRFHDFFSRVMEVTHRYHGRLNRISMGDKGSTFLLLFGTPSPLEKKEQLACQWALDVRELLEDEFPETTFKIGMNTGRAFTGIVGGSDRWDFTIMGDSVNFAARLMQGADSGQICISEALFEQVKSRYECPFLGERTFKGKAETLPVYSVEKRQAKRMAATGFQNLVGRQTEKETILSKLNHARSGNPCMVALEGEAGIGKSFLSDFILEKARDSWTVVSGRGDITLMNRTYAPWKEVLKAVIGEDRKLDLTILERLLRDTDPSFVPFLPWLAELLDIPCQRAMPEYDEETRKNLFHHHICSLVLNASKKNPVVLFLDDLHWFDTLSLDVLEALLNHFENQHFFVLATSRPEWDRERFEKRQQCQVVNLGDMDREMVRSLAAQRLDGAVRKELVSFIFDHARGNPFFSSQLLDYLVNEDLLVQRFGEWTLSRSAELKGELSGGDIVLAQVDRLSMSRKLHLWHAACIGPKFDSTLLKQAMGKKFRQKTMSDLVSHGFLLFDDDTSYSFPHALVQDTLYRSLLKKMRKKYHRKIGLAMEQVFGDDLTPFYPNLANHFYMADVRNKARNYSLQAGRNLFKQMSFPEAVNYFERAHVLLKYTSSREKWDVALELSQSYIKSGQLQHCIDFCRKIRSALRKYDLQNLYYQFSIVLCDAMLRCGDHSYTRFANTLLKGISKNNSSVKYSLMFYLGTAYYRQGKFEKAEPILNEVVGFQRNASLNDVISSAYVYLAYIDKSRSNFSSALEHITTGLDFVRKNNNVYQELRLQINHAGILMDSNEPLQAKQVLVSVLEQAEKWGDLYVMAVILLNLGNLEIDLNDFDSSLKHLSEADKLFVSIGALNGHAESLNYMGIIEFFKKNYTKAYDYYLQSADIYKAAGELQKYCEGLYNLSEVCLSMDRISEASEWFEKGISLIDQTNHPDMYAAYRELKTQL